MVRSVEDFARRRPVAFVLGSAAAGLVAGRLTRGMIDAGSDDDGARRIPAYPPAASIQPVGAGAIGVEDSEFASPPIPVTSSVGAGGDSTYGGVS